MTKKKKVLAIPKRMKNEYQCLSRLKKVHIDILDFFTDFFYDCFMYFEKKRWGFWEGVK